MSDEHLHASFQLSLNSWNFVTQHPNGHQARNDIATLKINLFEYPVSSVNQFANQFKNIKISLLTFFSISLEVIGRIDRYLINALYA